MDSRIILAHDLPDSTLHDRVARGELVRLARGVYTTDVETDPTDVVRRSWREIVGRRFGGAIVTDRSAVWGQPHDGYLFIASGREGVFDLPGVTVVSRNGPGAIEGDIAMGAGVHLASRPRALLDNTRSTRKRGDRPPATLSRAELADWIDHLCAIDGADQVSAYRDIAEGLADRLGASVRRVETLDDIVGAALGTRGSSSGSTAMKARAVGRPFDRGRVVRFELLADHLRDVVMTRPALPADAGRRATLPFWEAYFSNFIEGTEFTAEEAERIVRGCGAGRTPSGRSRRPWHVPTRIRRSRAAPSQRVGRRVHRAAPKLAPHDPGWPARQATRRVQAVPERGREHAVRRPRSGRRNTATRVRDPRILTTPTQKGAFGGFLVAEIHPFDDGNGRLARAVMNAEYVAGDEQRAVIPTISRNDYLRALRRLSRQDRPDLLTTYLDRVRRWTARMDWSDLATSRQLLEHTNAFADANDAEDRGVHLLDPATDTPAIVRARAD